MNDIPLDDMPPVEAYFESDGGDVVAPYPSVQDQTSRLLPHNVGAEKALLGAILYDNSALEYVSEFLRPKHFAVPEHGEVYAAILDMANRNVQADTITLASVFESNGNLAAMGGPSYLAELMGSVITIRNSGEYGRIIYDLHMKRELIHLGNALVNRSYEEDAARQIIDDAERGLSELVGDSAERRARNRRETIASALDHMQARFLDPDGMSGATTGLQSLDRLIMGLQPTDLIIVAGRPSMGKTTLAQKFAVANASPYQKSNGAEGCPVAFFSLEMSAEQLIMRMASDRANVPLSHIRSGRYHHKDFFDKVIIETQALEQLPLYIDDTGGLSAHEILSRARRMKRTHGLGLIIIDQLPYIRFSDPKGRRVEQLGLITRDLKNGAKELGLPVVLLHQLSRDLEKRDDKRPQLSDLRDSGEIEQDADVVMFVYRDEYYLERAEPAQRSDEGIDKFATRLAHWQDRMAAAKGVAEIIAAKQRMGSVGKALVSFQGTYNRLANLARDEGYNTTQEDLL